MAGHGPTRVPGNAAAHRAAGPRAGAARRVDLPEYCPADGRLVDAGQPAGRGLFTYRVSGPQRQPARAGRRRDDALRALLESLFRGTGRGGRPRWSVAPRLSYATGGLAGGQWIGCAALLLQGLFGLAHPPVAGLMGGAALAAGCVFGLAWWLRTTTAWLRAEHLLVGQLLLTVALLGLHEAGLNWPLTVTLLYGEVLGMLLLLAWQREWLVYRVLLYGSLGLAGLLPLLIYRGSPGLLSPEQRALLLVLAAGATTATQALLHRQAAPAYDALPFSYLPIYRLRLLGFAGGGLLLAAGGLVYQHTWASGLAVALGAGGLLVRRSRPVPGLWMGLLVAASGYHLLQWSYVLGGDAAAWRSGALLVYLGPLLALPGVGLACSWWEARQQHTRWPWLYLLGLHAAVLAWAALAPHSPALPVLGWLGLAAGAAGAAHWRRPRGLAASPLRPDGSPDRYLLHLTYGLIGLALAYHLGRLVPSHALLLQVPARRVTATALVVLLAGFAALRPPGPAAPTGAGACCTPCCRRSRCCWRLSRSAGKCGRPGSRCCGVWPRCS
ncbi:hypothetical protein [Hymenobacter sp. HDW8]|uniref:hypothetical protein n=1 Tax=Hymenobacter sp. HDW8 TaxID=2714932 RepID=UPI0014092A4D|nr:hypothetical protein [Hymenobacter sp. HDW8]QIL78296.1 hypothetical protein G7064_20975 [Hymenobacter sp. HDW8]